ncbi:MAG TPA: PadR family transcriptional regulator [Clostridia bacterium]|nr:PadR family transcriptional regulator [Clostridia bacterium]
MNAQMKKGVLEMCVLALLAQRDCYGFELVGIISRNVSMSEGTVYPLLKRLRDEALLTTYLVESQEGPPRKYYKITPLGAEKLAVMRAEWETFCAGVDQILEGREEA